jgi:hypothetical protein
MIWFILYIVIAFGLMVAEGYLNTFDGERLLAFLACIAWPLALAVEVVVLIFSAPFMLGKWLAKEPKP